MGVAISTSPVAEPVVAWAPDETSVESIAADGIWARLDAFMTKTGLRPIDFFRGIGDGTISKDEFVCAIQRLHQVAATDEEIDALMQQVDADRDGTVNLHEFNHAVRTQKHRVLKERMRQSDKPFDKFEPMAWSNSQAIQKRNETLTLSSISGCEKNTQGLVCGTCEICRFAMVQRAKMQKFTAARADDGALELALAAKVCRNSDNVLFPCTSNSGIKTIASMRIGEAEQRKLAKKKILWRFSELEEKLNGMGGCAGAHAPGSQMLSACSVGSSTSSANSCGPGVLRVKVRFTIWDDCLTVETDMGMTLGEFRL
jgi:hypothetical protein